MVEVPEVECHAGHGLKGDRFFDHKKNYRGQVTFFQQEVYEDLQSMLQVYDRQPDVFRRNIIVSGIDLNLLIGDRFTLQGVEFEGTEECSPCYWMDRAFAPGAKEALHNRGGLRAKIITDGTLKTGPHAVPLEILTRRLL